MVCSLLAVGLAFGGTSHMDLALWLLALQTEMTAEADEIEIDETDRIIEFQYQHPECFNTDLIETHV